MRSKITTWLAWIWFGVFVTLVIGTMLTRPGSANDDVWQLLDVSLWSLFVILFTFVGALIVSRQPRNTVGWLVMITPVFYALNGLTSIYVEGSKTIPAEPSNLFVVAAWLNNILYLPMLFSALFILQLFPSGRVLSPRWRWLIVLGLGLCIIFPTFAMLFEAEIPLGASGAIPNPISSSLPDALHAAYSAYSAAGIVLFIIFIVGSMASLFIRYRRASQIERKQIKWLLYACSLFGVVLMINFGSGDSRSPLVDNLLGLAFGVSFATIPVAIAVAILRYNLWDINVIIRKTVIYGVLSALLALVYFGVIVLLQSIFEAASGQQSPISIVISTLIIAALFLPLLRWVQDVIDRRFFRAEYNAQQVLADFARRAQDETDLRMLQAELIRMVQETLQPTQITLWIRSTEDRNEAKTAMRHSQRQPARER